MRIFLPALSVVFILGTSRVFSQDLTVHVDNSIYDFAVVSSEGRPVFTVTGFAPVQADGPTIPSRRVEIPLPPAGSYAFAVRNPVLTAPYGAIPYYFVEYAYGPDSVISEKVRLFKGPEPAGDSIPQHLSARMEWRDGERIAVVEVPLLAYSRDRSEVRWIRSCEVVARRSTGAALPESATPSGFASQPFVRQSTDLDTSGTWIDHDQDAIVFHINRDGMYKLTPEWFAAQGFDASNITPSRVRLYRKGKEIPLFAHGMDDQRIDAGDYFLFAGERNYDEKGYKRLPASPNEPYPQYLNKYTDSSAYWVFVEGEAGQRVPVATPATGATGDTLDWYFEPYHYELENWLYATSTDPVWQQLCDWTWDETWFTHWLQPGGIPQYGFQASNVRPGIRPKVTVKVGSWGSEYPGQPNHSVFVRLNAGEPIDSVQFNKNEQALLAVRGKEGEVVEGSNTITYISSRLYQETNIIYVDWWEVEYPRFLVARGDSLQFSVDAEMGTGVRRFRIDGLQTANVMLFRIANGRTVRIDPVAITGSGPYSFHGADTLYENAQYLLSNPDRLATPAGARRHRIARLRDVANQAAYVMITSRALHAEGEQYVDFIRQKYSVRTRVVDVEDIYDNYSYGMFNPESIKLFLFDAAMNWTTDRPRFVCLAGDANADYKKPDGEFRQNVVPSYGHPVSDIWFVCFDAAALAPSMAIGRLTAREPGQLTNYMEKHRFNLEAAPGLWNKSTIHFSGGFASTPGQIEELKAANERVITEVVRPAPFGGHATHFYKTIIPRTDFGPYTPLEVKQKIDSGGVIISYIGHSALQTWDNSIGDPKQLDNMFGKGSVVTDFGCSTSKFADPDRDSFAEMFVMPAGSQAIAYIGNAASGFTSTAVTQPLLFYKSLLQDGMTTLGAAHVESKKEILRLYGPSLVNRIAIQSNVLIGDPITRIPVAERPNLATRSEWLKADIEILTDDMDSISFTIQYANAGKVIPQDSVLLRIQILNAGVPVWSRDVKRALPFYIDSVRIRYPTGNIPGTFVLRCMLDPDNRLDEFDETDNQADYPFTILSAFMQVANAQLGRKAGGWSPVAILHPLISPGPVNSIVFEFDRSPDFRQPMTMRAPYGKLATFLDSIPGLPPDTDYFWRASLDVPNPSYIGPFAFRTGSRRAAHIIRDSTDFAKCAVTNLRITDAGCVPGPRTVSLRIIGSGYDDGNFGIIEVGGRNVLPTTFGRGYFIAVIDSATLRTDTVVWFDTYETVAQAEALRDFILQVPIAKHVAICSIDEPSTNAAVCAEAMETIGSKHFDQVIPDSTGFRSSWVILGRKRAAIGTVPEMFTRRFQGKATIDTLLELPPDSAFLVTKPVGPASRWGAVFLERSRSSESRIGMKITGISRTGTRTPLLNIVNADSIDLSGIDPQMYPSIEAEALLLPMESSVMPVLRGIAFAFQYLPELCLNYQSVSLDADSVEQGVPVTLSAGIINAGEAVSSATLLAVDAEGSDNVRKPVAMVAVPPLAPRQRFDTLVTIPTSGYSRDVKIMVTADRTDAVPEQYENNNVFVTRLFVQPDTVRPELAVRFDGAVPTDGDYIRPTPRITMELSDASPLRVTSPSHFEIMLDGLVVSTDSLEFTPMGTTTSARLAWSPKLADGEHEFRFNARDASSNPAMVDGYSVRLLVDGTAKLSNLYPYPNPFSHSTSFTFLATGARVFDKAEIKIYSVAGRLIRRLTAERDQLRIGFNRVEWDGRDDDGDEIANGVYLFKIIATLEDGTTEQLGRVAKLK